MTPDIVTALANVGTGFGVAGVLAGVLYKVITENRKDQKDLTDRVIKLVEDNIRIQTEAKEALITNASEVKDASIRTAESINRLAEKVTEIIMKNK